MIVKAIDTLWIGEFQAQLYYDDYGIEVVRIYKQTMPTIEYYASTILEIDEGLGLMLDVDSRIQLTADQVKELKDFIIGYLVNQFICNTEDKIHLKVKAKMNKRKGW